MHHALDSIIVGVRKDYSGLGRTQSVILYLFINSPGLVNRARVNLTVSHSIVVVWNHQTISTANPNQVLWNRVPDKKYARIFFNVPGEFRRYREAYPFSLIRPVFRKSVNPQDVRHREVGTTASPLPRRSLDAEKKISLAKNGIGGPKLLDFIDK